MSDLLERMRSNPRGDWTLRDIERVCLEYDVTCAPPKAADRITRYRTGEYPGS